MILNNVNDFSFIYKQYNQLIHKDIYKFDVNDDLTLISKNKDLLNLLINALSQY